MHPRSPAEMPGFFTFEDTASQLFSDFPAHKIVFATKATLSLQ
jgi:hypothetical protein